VAEFHEPVELPGSIDHARQLRTSRLVGVGLAGMGVRLLVIAAELTGYFLLGHSVLLVDALSTIADVIAGLLIVLAIKLAERPPDAEHPFGHGKYEPLAGLQLGVLISLFGVFMLVQQGMAAGFDHIEGRTLWWAWAIPAGVAVALELFCQLALRTGRREHSTALVAEAYHFRVDAVASLLAAVGLGAAALAPGAGALVDHLCAMLLAAIMAALGAFAAWENLHQLLDRAPSEAAFQRVRNAAAAVAGVHDVEKVRIQCAGPDAHVDIDVEVDPAITVHNAHEIAQLVRVSIQTEWPAVREVVVHVEPFYEGDH